MPAYVRAGAVIPFGPAMQYTGEKPVDPLSVDVYGFAPKTSPAPRQSEFSLYEDDGLTNAYQRGEFQRTPLRFSRPARGSGSRSPPKAAAAPSRASRGVPIACSSMALRAR